MPSATKLAVTLLLKADTKGFRGKMAELEKTMTGSIRRMNIAGYNLVRQGQDSLRSGMSNIAKGTAILAPIAAAARESAKLEEAYVGVSRAANVAFDSKQMEQYRESIRGLSDDTGDSESSLVELTHNLLQNGVAREKVLGVTETLAKASKALGVENSDLASSYTTTMDAMSLTTDQADRMLEAVNATTKQFGGVPKELLNFVSGSARAAEILKISETNLTAFGNAFQAAGINAQGATRTMDRFQQSIVDNESLRKIFMGAGGGSAGLTAILRQANESGNAIRFFRDRGLSARRAPFLARLAGQMNSENGLMNQLSFVSNASNLQGSLSSDYEEWANRTTGQFQKLSRQALNVGMDLGNSLLPSLISLMKRLKPIVESITNWVHNNPGWVSAIMKAVAVFGALRVGLGAVQFLFGGTIATIGKLALTFSRSFAVIRAAFAALSVIVNTNPIMLLITGIALAAFLIIKNWDQVSAFFVNLWDKVSKAFSKFVTWLKDKFLNNPVVKAITKIFGTIFGGKKNSISIAGDITPDNINPVGNPRNVPQPVPVRGGNSLNYSSSPTINISGSATQADANRIQAAVDRANQKQYERMKHEQQRVGFGLTPTM